MRRYGTGIAASLLLLAGIGYYRYSVTNSSGKTYEAFAATMKHAAMEYVNSSDTMQHIQLEDGSGVNLYTGSRLTYSRAALDKREVYLDGEAFFNVIKKPSQPFIVYTDKVVTKVLGTSFTIRAYEHDKRVVVTVRTGKVSVFRRDNFTEKNMQPFEPGGLVVTPNQQVFFDQDNMALHKTLVDRPTVLDTVATPDPAMFIFNETPVKEVFARMQKAYGINIVFDEELMDSCSLSASMSNEPFYEKMELICKTLNASYEIIDGNVVITSSGCR
jgi:transmembrane sensor